MEQRGANLKVLSSLYSPDKREPNQESLKILKVRKDKKKEENKTGIKSHRPKANAKRKGTQKSEM